MVDVKQTEVFTDWLAALADRKAAGIIAARIIRVRLGLKGDVKSVGGKVSELRVDFGPGYRVYFTQKGAELIILLCGGDKSSQAGDIKRAQEMVASLQ
ncbi:type II toxin-antitoxin system RelE/ParE family toxin [Luteimonas sp. SJ-92]|uniref:Type II toxin-antitoxin system RelE/ParE family toxin n=1 Tax=Luteimonas salinisoli TaxID=2752307 RepID=A0A853JEN4_9GAMM|nr:type II toxin-antitoxin system RelE/ParE family toxin [Luteimonas salinisoli]NZA27224.1 type II toxin-antitoxin system RelE/ParE family toxin [Luteimonas salinisoli]